MTLMISKALLSVALLLTPVIVPPAAAQDKKGENANTRSVQGAVTDTENNAVDGAVVQLKDTKSLQVRSFITKKDGTYHFQGLSQNVDYELRAEYQSFSSDPKTLSNFDSRKQASINLTIKSKSKK